MLSFCGLKCDACPIYLATLEKNITEQFAMREAIAKKCLEIYNMNISVKDITDCDGCRANSGRLFSGCQKCEIRKCVQTKKLGNCALCSVFPCLKLEEIFWHDPDAKKRLMKIRNVY